MTVKCPVSFLVAPPHFPVWRFLAPRSRASIFLQALAIALSAVIASGCHVKQSKIGDAVAFDRGPFSYYPRYRIEFPCLALSQGSSYSFKINGLPAAEYLLRMVVVKDGSAVTLADWDGASDHLVKTGIRGLVEVWDESGSAPHLAAASTGALPGHWGPAAWGEERFFMVDELTAVQLSASQYRVDFRFDVEGPTEPDVAFELCPVFVGGGVRE